ncbi:MAG: triose-phosphate isomerase [Planctomyces sp.]
MRRYLIAGNWKMNLTLASGTSLAKDLAAHCQNENAGVEVLACPAYPYLLAVGSAISGSSVRLGAQDAYFENPGAFTGEVSVEMLKDCDCQYVILGHSERRHVLGESNATINRKVKAVISGGLRPILCVGELLQEREAGKTEKVLDEQMAEGLQNISEAEMSDLVIAYEPVWAIGTGVTATPDQAQSAHAHLRKWLKIRYNDSVSAATRILYGGSVKADNAETLLGQPDVDGALVGGASLKGASFIPIIDAARKLSV